MQEETAFLKLHLTENIGSRTIYKLVKAVGSAAEVLNLSDEDLMFGFNISPDSVNFLRKNDKLVCDEIKLIEKQGAELITILDNKYPEILKTIPDPPCILYVLGNEKCLHDDMIGIVGTRRASIYAKESAQTLARDFSCYGLTVVSGFARGVDTFAHFGALEGESPTVAVIGSGLNHLYPKENRKLADEIIEKQGAIITEFSMKTNPGKTTFPRRNRIISGFAGKGVVVIEAALRSGSLITARYAKQYGRDLYVVPGGILSSKSQGSNQLIKQGAKLIDSVQDVVDGWADPEDDINELKLTKQEKIVLDLLDKTPVSIDKLSENVAKKGLTLQNLMSILMRLEIKGCVRQVAGKRYMEGRI